METRRHAGTRRQPRAILPRATGERRHVSYCAPSRVRTSVRVGGGPSHRCRCLRLRSGCLSRSTHPSRLLDAITAAGGALPEADLESINLARILVDGEQIRVGVAGESPPPSSPEGNTSAGACVRLNTATETELQTLPGIGPALAKRIVTYRSTHPRLTSVDELDDVPGIGPSLIEKIRPGVCG